MGPGFCSWQPWVGHWLLPGGMLSPALRLPICDGCEGAAAGSDGAQLGNLQSQAQPVS